MTKKEQAPAPETQEIEQSFEAKVWMTLSRIDVTDHIDVLPKTAKRPEVKYLPWHRAWALLKRKFPASTYSHRPDLHHTDGTVEVEVDVVIASVMGGDTQFTNARLAVMDNWFNPITEPSARQVNDTRQRCLVKALAFAGLGLNLWSDSIIPVGKLDDPISPEQYEELSKLIVETDTDEPTFLRWCECDDLESLPYERYGSALRLLQAKKRRQERLAKEAK
jgi:hypothetical protein